MQFGICKALKDIHKSQTMFKQISCLQLCEFRYPEQYNHIS